MRRIRDPETRASLLLDSLEACPANPCAGSPGTLLEEARRAVAQVSDAGRRAALLLRLGRLLRQRGHPQQADSALDQALAAARQDPEAGAGLMLRLALALEQAGRPDEARALWRAYDPDPVPAAVAQPSPPFPFRQRPLQGAVGLTAGGTVFTDSTALATLDLDLYKQWPRHDLQFELLLAADYDDSRDPRAGAIRPQMQQLLVARRHLNAELNLFFDQITSLNTDTFAASNDDEDTSLLSTTLTGIGFNLWRGVDPGSFHELQLGLGARYRYDEIGFNRVRDEIDPVLGIVYRSRQIETWLGIWEQTLGLVAPPGDLADLSILSTTRLSVPLSTRWSWTNILELRYEERRPGPGFPQARFQFSSGINYSF